MKKTILTAFCLGLMLAGNVVMAEQNQVAITITANNDDRQAVKAEELPDAIKKTLAADDYKGWSVKEAALVKAEKASHYEVTLTNEKETKVVKFKEDGSVLN